jgi:CheY-like chemotaxis protein
LGIAEEKVQRLSESDPAPGREEAHVARELTMHGVALARKGRHAESLELLRRAHDAAFSTGDDVEAARAALSLIEEHGTERLTNTELSETYRHADKLLADSRDASDLSRLRACAQIVARKLSGPKLEEGGFSLREVVLEYEGRFIEEALRVAGGSVTQAARLLGVGHQALTEILKGRHKELQRLRTPVARRRRREELRRSSAARAGRGADAQASREPDTLSILVVEDHPTVAETIRETLEAEGWRVLLCPDGASAFRKIEGGERFDVLVYDHKLPDNFDGLELIRHTRTLPHRRRTPVIMLSACDVEADAWRAGASAYLTKPHGIRRLADMIVRLTTRSK